MLLLKSFSKIENHPLNKAWSYMLNHLKEFIIEEISKKGNSENFCNIAKNMNYESKYTFSQANISFEESMDIINSTINYFYTHKKDIILSDPEKYTSIFMYFMNILISTYNNQIEGHVLFRSDFTFLDNDIQELIIKECLLDPNDEKKYASWTNNFINTEKLKMIIRTSDIKNIGKYILKNNSDEYGFVDNSDFFIFEENKKDFVGRISAFELYLFETKFWESTSPQEYSNAIELYRKYMERLQIEVIKGNDKILKDTFLVNKRYNDILMIKCCEENNDFRLNSLIQSFISPFSFIVGQKYTKKYYENICELIKEIAQTSQKDSINVPYKVAISLIEKCYSTDLMELDVFEMDKYLKNILEICWENATNELKYDNDKFFENHIIEICKTDYKGLVRQYMNAINNAKFDYKSYMIPSNDFPQIHFIPEEAFENAEDILKIPMMTYGRTLPVAISFFISKIKQKLKRLKILIKCIIF